MPKNPQKMKHFKCFSRCSSNTDYFHHKLQTKNTWRFDMPDFLLDDEKKKKKEKNKKTIQ